MQTNSPAASAAPLTAAVMTSGTDRSGEEAMSVAPVVSVVPRPELAPDQSGSQVAPKPAPSDARLEEHRPPSAERTGSSTPASADLEFRARAEDFILWAVIAAVLAYLAWYLQSTTAALAATVDIERLAVYGLNVRANLVLLVGGALALLGCMIVLRRVRMSFSARAQFEGSRARVVADSAGIVIVLLAVVLIAIVVTHPPRVERNGNPFSEVDAGPGTRDLDTRLQKLKAQQAKDPARDISATKTESEEK